MSLWLPDSNNVIGASKLSKFQAAIETVNSLYAEVLEEANAEKEKLLKESPRWILGERNETMIRVVPETIMPNGKVSVDHSRAVVFHGGLGDKDEYIREATAYVGWRNVRTEMEINQKIQEKYFGNLPSA